ncbi:MAG: hypothetical protein K2O63_05185 [Alistipes sp.]|nr:hypothetical protein [Alistipes sp.]
MPRRFLIAKRKLSRPMSEIDQTDTTRSISDEELLLKEVVGNDTDLYYLHFFLSEILQKG